MMVLGTTGANFGFLVYTNAIRDTSTSAIQSEIKDRKGIPGFAKTFKIYAPFLIKANRLLLNFGPQGSMKFLEAKGTPKEREMMESYLRFKASGVTGSTLIGEDWRNRKAFASETYARTANILSLNNKRFERTMARNQLRWFVAEHPIDAIRQLLSTSEELNRFPSPHKNS